MASTQQQDLNWWRQAAVYQIYPRSFASSARSKTNPRPEIGTLKGIIDRIPYLASLSLDAIWLSPCYPSQLADGGYDVDDYRDISPDIGTLQEFDEEFIPKLKEAGIKLYLDIVPNHSSNLHEWFKAALASPKGSKEREMYHFRDGKGEDQKEPPSDWLSIFGGSAWEPVGDGQFYLHIFDKSQPDLNWDNRAVRDDFLKTLKFWSDKGVSGFRIDVAHAMTKDMSEPLPPQSKIDHWYKHDILDDKTGKHFMFDRDETHEIFLEWRKLFDSYDPPRTAVAEAWVPVAARRAMYASKDSLGQAFNFDLLSSDFEPKRFRDVITTNLREAKAAGSSSTWVLSNHDVVRHATRYALPPGADDSELGDRGNFQSGGEWQSNPKGADRSELDVQGGLNRARAATLLELALPGATYIYQGEELGLEEVTEFKPEDRQDPSFFRTKGKVAGRDGCRVPLPWKSERETADSKSYGFGPEGSHLPQPDWYGKYSVEAQDGVKGSTLELYRKALKLRRELQSGEELEWIDVGDENVLAFKRPTEGGWTSVTNFGKESVELPKGKVVVSSADLDGGKLPKDTTAWLVDA